MNPILHPLLILLMAGTPPGPAEITAMAGRYLAAPGWGGQANFDYWKSYGPGTRIGLSRETPEGTSTWSYELLAADADSVRVRLIGSEGVSEFTAEVVRPGDLIFFRCGTEPPVRTTDSYIGPDTLMVGGASYVCEVFERETRIGELDPTKPLQPASRSRVWICPEVESRSGVLRWERVYGDSRTPSPRVEILGIGVERMVGDTGYVCDILEESRPREDWKRTVWASSEVPGGFLEIEERKADWYSIVRVEELVIVPAE